MSYQKHWKRQKEAEGQAIKYSWRNKHNQRTMEVIDTGRERDGNSVYEVAEDGVPKNEEFTNQEKASDRAKEIMKRKPYDDVSLSGDELHDKLMEVGREIEPDDNGVANDLSENDIETFVMTLKAFGLPQKVVQQAYSDLTQYEYRVFDHIGMMLDTDLGEKGNWIYQKFANIYIEERSVDGLIRRLRTDDLLLEYRHGE